MAEQRCGGGGRATGTQPRLKGAEEQVTVVGGKIEQRSEYRTRGVERHLGRGRDKHGERAVLELVDAGLLLRGWQREAREAERPSGLAQLDEHPADSDSGRRMPTEHGEQSVEARADG